MASVFFDVKMDIFITFGQVYNYYVHFTIKCFVCQTKAQKQLSEIQSPNYRIYRFFRTNLTEIVCDFIIFIYSKIVKLYLI